MSISQVRQIDIAIGVNSERHIGSRNACYEIEETSLPRPHSGAVLEKLTIQGGKILTFGAQIAIGRKDQPFHMTSDSYVLKLLHLESKYVVLWDDADKRGWLVNAISVVLHLVRTRLSILQQGDFASVIMLDHNDLVDAGQRKHNSAVAVLLNEQNRRSKVFVDSNRAVDETSESAQITDTPNATSTQRTTRHETQYLLFQDFAEQFCDSLERLIVHQNHAAGQNGINMKQRLRHHLEGWDFMDIANGYDAHARVATLNTLGWNWVDFVRSINAVILFGCRFGELLIPRTSHSSCLWWNTVPRGQYYLAVNVGDLQKMPQVRCRKRIHPPELIEGLAWHSPSPLLKVCACSTSRQQNGLPSSRTTKCDPVTVLYSTIMNRRLSRSVNLVNASTLPASAAVIFGHHVSWNYKWRNNGQDARLDAYTEQQNSLNTLSAGHDVLSASISSSSQVSGQVAIGSSMQLSFLTTPDTSVSGDSGATSGQPSDPSMPTADSSSLNHQAQTNTTSQSAKPRMLRRKLDFLSLIKNRAGRRKTSS